MTMRQIIDLWLRRMAGSELAGDIIGDVAESGAGAGRLLSITVGIMARRIADAMATIWRSRPKLSGGGADLRYTARSLRRSPWYAATVIGVIALSMSLAITVFAVVDGVLFKPLPYPQASHLYSVWPGFARLGRSQEPMGASLVDLANWSAATGDTGITGFSVENTMIGGDPSSDGTYALARVQPNFFDVIGVRPLLGGFDAGDFHADFDHLPLLTPAVISYSVWQARFHGAADAVGQTMIADRSTGRGYRVSGIMPAGFLFPSARADAQIITPEIVPQAFLLDPRSRGIREVVARTPAGVSRDELRSRIEAGMAVTAATFPAPRPSSDPRRASLSGPYDRADVMPLSSVMGIRERPVFAAIFIAAVILVSLGAINVSGLLAARCLDRTRELSLRRALGAGADGIVQLVVFEALVLIAAGCALGFAVAPSLLHVGLALLPSRLSLLKVPAIDWRVAMFVAVSALILAVPASIWPIRRALGIRAAALADGNTTSERRRSTGRFIVIASQVAGAAILTIFGALLVSSTLALYVISPNVDTDNVVSDVAIVTGAGGQMGVSVERTARVAAVIDHLRAMPGVSAAAAMSGQTLRGGIVKSWFNPPATAANPALDVTVLGGTRDLFRVLDLRVVDGRLPTEAELAHDEPLVVIGELVARAYFPETSAVGRILTYGDDARPYRIVGVVKDVRWQGMDQPTGNIYGPFAVLSRSTVVGFYVRTAANGGVVKAGLPAAIVDADPLFQPSPPTMLAERFSDSIRARRLQAWLFGSFATSSLTIVGVGIFGLMAMAMARRSREVGIRMALGASRAQTVSVLMREQLSAVAIGLVAGAAFAAWSVRFMSWFLYSVGAYDLRIWSVAIATIAATAMTGTLVPSLRASRIDPVRALRED
jgi:predicted permease